MQPSEHKCITYSMLCRILHYVEYRNRVPCRFLDYLSDMRLTFEQTLLQEEDCSCLTSPNATLCLSIESVLFVGLLSLRLICCCRPSPAPALPHCLPCPAPLPALPHRQPHPRLPQHLIIVASNHNRHSTTWLVQSNESMM